MEPLLTLWSRNSETHALYRNSVFSYDAVFEDGGASVRASAVQVTEHLLKRCAWRVCQSRASPSLRSGFASTIVQSSGVTVSRVSVRGSARAQPEPRGPSLTDRVSREGGFRNPRWIVPTSREICVPPRGGIPLGRVTGGDSRTLDSTLQGGVNRRFFLVSASVERCQVVSLGHHRPAVPGNDGWPNGRPHASSKYQVCSAPETNVLPQSSGH